MKRQTIKNNSKICAIICELNPMHTGHKHLIDEARKITNCDYLIGLMSGNFSQRSEVCILDKYTRAKIAANNGMDMVLNFPTAFCTNNAEVFALSSIKILNQTKVDYLAFGVETTNEQAFYLLAKFMLNEPKEFKKKLKQNLKSGLAYFNAYTKTIFENQNLIKDNVDVFLNILSKPNNTLALEYIKAIIKTKSTIKPIFVKRIDNYNSDEIKENFVGANFIRKNLIENSLSKVEKFLPENSINIFEENLNNIKNAFNKNLIIKDEKVFEIPQVLKTLIMYKLKFMTTKQISKIYGANEGIENRLKTEVSKTSNFDIFYKNILTKRYKQNRINSILLNSLLEIEKSTILKIYTTKTNIYIKILAINPKKRDILSKINAKYFILRKLDVQKLKLNKFNKKLFEIENSSNKVYNLIFKSSLIEEDLYNKMRD